MTGEPFLKQFEFHVRAGSAGLWVVGHEAEEVARALAALDLGPEAPVQLFHWDAADGVRDLLHGVKDYPHPCAPIAGLKDPVAVLAAFRKRALEKAEGDVHVLLLANFHLALDHPVVKQTFVNAVQEGKAHGLVYAVLSPKSEMPLEFDHLVTQLDFKPPTRDEVLAIARAVQPGLLDRPEVADAVLGLTRREAEQALALAAIRDSFRPEPDVAARFKALTEDLWAAKEQALRQKPFLKLLRSRSGFEALGGMGGVKRFMKAVLEPDDEFPPKGVLLLGPPGTGKSALAKALGVETNRAVVQLDLGACYNKHVGESEGAIRSALATVDALGPVVLFLDEVEKALAGVGGEGDSGVSSRVFGTLLTWLSDRAEKRSEVFAVMTSNDISKLPPEFSRAGRFDRIFFLDLPDEAERDAIWKLYTTKYAIPWEQHLAVKDAAWTGAEIEQACYLARKLKVPLVEASSEIVPVSETYSEVISRLRTESAGRYICARTGKKYQPAAAPTTAHSPHPDALSRRRNLIGGSAAQSRTD